MRLFRITVLALLAVGLSLPLSAGENLKSADEHRMTRLVMSFPASDHLVQEWTSKTGAKEEVSRFEFTRKK